VFGFLVSAAGIVWSTSPMQPIRARASHAKRTFDMLRIPGEFYVFGHRGGVIYGGKTSRIKQE